MICEAVGIPDDLDGLISNDLSLEYAHRPRSTALPGTHSLHYAQEMAQTLYSLAPNSPKQRTGHILGYMGQTPIPGSTCSAPTLCGFYPSELPKQTPRHLYWCALVGSHGSAHTTSDPQTSASSTP